MWILLLALLHVNSFIVPWWAWTLVGIRTFFVVILALFDSK